MFAKLSLKIKLLVAFLCVGIIPFAVMAIVALTKSESALHDQAFAQLEAVRGIKKAQIERFFNERRDDMGVLVETVGTLRKEAFDKLTAVREVKRGAVERYFQTINDQIITFSEDRMVVDAMRQFKTSFRNFRKENGSSPADVERMRRELLTYYTGPFSTEYAKQNQGRSPNVEQYFRKLDDDSIATQYQYIRANTNPLGSKHLLDQADDASSYSKLHAKVHPIIRNFLEKFGYYDIFLVDIESGDIVYSVFKELDFSTSLIDGPNAQTNFGEAFRKAADATTQDAVVLVDYAQYTPSYEAPAGFIASPIFDGDEKIGVAMFQMPIDRLNTIMSERAGLGETGETYLVGPDDLMRSDSYLDPKHHSVVASFKKPESGKVVTTASKAGLEGKIGAEVILDYNGNPVLSAYTPVKVGNFTWALLTEIDVAEAFCPKDQAGTYFFDKYIEMYGYYDLFLINPDGYCFYTVAKEPDYQTNMVNGKYADSGLGRLTRQVLETRQYAVADFAPYAPSNGAPAAFIAQPVVNDGKVELIVALQLSLKAINDIMTQRDGMGETGETYLIGQDKLMRSDSYLDPKHHSVLASFADPQKGNVDTDASREALSGKTDTRITRDYNGNPVLSAYTPIKIESLQWALLAEIDEAEAFAAIKALQWVAFVVAAIGIAGIVALALLITRAIVRPVQGVVDNLTELAQGEGDLTSRLAVTTQDEIGKLAERFNEFMEKLHAMIKDITSGVETLSSSSTELSAISQQMSAGAEQTSGKANTVATAAEEMSANMTSVSAAMEQSSTNTGMVAAASEEMTATINEIAKNAENARGISDQAVHQTKDAGKQMADLGRAAQAIGKVTETITEISEQTNLLALNATIEAARAGEAGKGFAVVANEIKELAKQTAEATLDIKRQIGGIQDSTGNTVTSIEQIGRVINDVNDIVASIATAVEEQSVSTKEIAENIAQVSNGIGEVNQNVAQSSQVAGDITRDITEVNQAADEMARSSSQVRLSAEELSKLAEQLTEMVGRFKI